jgi:integrase
MIEHLSKNKAKLIVSTGSGKNRKRYSKIVKYKGKKDLDRMYAAFEQECTQVKPTDETVEEIINAYIDSRKLLGAKATTLRGYRMCRDRIDGVLRRQTASQVNPYQVDKYIAQIANKYAPKTIRNTISLLSSAYDRAIQLGLLTENPCAKVTLPKQSQPEIKTLSEEDVIKLMSALEGERLDFKVGYELCLFCGLRRSEVLGLKESDVNLAFRTVTISKTRHVVDGETQIQDTKTERSRRSLALPGFICEDIRQLIELHASYEWEHDDHLILTPFGEPMHPSTFSDHLPLIEQQHGIQHVSVHGLRHTFATMLNSSGIDIARISAELGHSNISTTLNKYTHVFGGATASSRGIADEMEIKFSKTAPNLPLEAKEKTAEA